MLTDSTALLKFSKDKFEKQFIQVTKHVILHKTFF